MRAYPFVSCVVVSALTVAASPAAVTGCPTDIVDNGVIDVADLVEVVLSLGACPGCPAELNGDGIVDGMDVLAVAVSLGSCGSTDEPAALAGGSMHICAVEDGSFATDDGGCKDLATGLVWGSPNMGVGGGSWTWAGAKNQIELSSEGGFTDWRMPSRDEWQAVIANGAVTHFAGSFSPNGWYWTSKKTGQWAWMVQLSTGDEWKVLAASATLFTGVRDSSAGSPPDPGGACDNDGICDPGENCESCGDCEGKTNGPPSGRYCCGNGELEGPEGDGSICDGNP